MPTIPGKIVNRQGKVVAEADIWIEVIQERPGALPDWHGACELPEAHGIRIDEPTYRLELSDGRSGDIILRNLSLPSANLEFQGTGPLE